MQAHYKFGDYLFVYEGKNALTKNEEVWVNRVSPYFEPLNISFELKGFTVVHNQKNVSEQEIAKIVDVLRENSGCFSLKKQKSYLKKGSHIVALGSGALGKIMNQRFIQEPDFEAGVKLHHHLLESHCLLDFDRSFYREAISINQCFSIIKQIEDWQEEFELDSYDEYTHFKRGRGWHVAGDEIVEGWQIEGLDDLIIVGNRRGS